MIFEKFKAYLLWYRPTFSGQILTENPINTTSLQIIISNTLTHKQKMLINNLRQHRQKYEHSQTKTKQTIHDYLGQKHRKQSSTVNSQIDSNNKILYHQAKTETQLIYKTRAKNKIDTYRNFINTKESKNGYLRTQSSRNIGNLLNFDDRLTTKEQFFSEFRDKKLEGGLGERGKNLFRSEELGSNKGTSVLQQHKTSSKIQKKTKRNSSTKTLRQYVDSKQQRGTQYKVKNNPIQKQQRRSLIFCDGEMKNKLCQKQTKNQYKVKKFQSQSQVVQASRANYRSIVLQNQRRFEQQQEEQQLIQSLKFNEVFFCSNCCRYIFAIEKAYHYPKCRTPLHLQNLTQRQKYNLGLQKLRLLLELSQYTTQKQKQIKYLYDCASKRKIISQNYQIHVLPSRKYFNLMQIQTAACVIIAKLITPTLDISAKDGDGICGKVRCDNRNQI